MQFSFSAMDEKAELPGAVIDQL